MKKWHEGAVLLTKSLTGVARRPKKVQWNIGDEEKEEKKEDKKSASREEIQRRLQEEERRKKVDKMSEAEKKAEREE